jgi:hypothetical protein
MTVDVPVNLSLVGLVVGEARLKLLAREVAESSAELGEVARIDVII